MHILSAVRLSPCPPLFASGSSIVAFDRRSLDSCYWTGLTLYQPSESAMKGKAASQDARLESCSGLRSRSSWLAGPSRANFA